MEDIPKLLREKGVEIDLGDHRTPHEIALALGIVAVEGHENDKNSNHIQHTQLAKRPKDSPYLAY